MGTLQVTPDSASRAGRGCARGGVDDLPRRIRPHGAGRPAFNSRAGRFCRSKPGAYSLMKVLDAAIRNLAAKGAS